MEKTNPLKKNPRINSSVYSQPQFYLLTYIVRERERERERLLPDSYYLLSTSILFTHFYSERERQHKDRICWEKEGDIAEKADGDRPHSATRPPPLLQVHAY